MNNQRQTLGQQVREVMDDHVERAVREYENPRARFTEFDETSVDELLEVFERVCMARNETVNLQQEMLLFSAGDILLGMIHKFSDDEQTNRADQIINDMSDGRRSKS